jgi:D-aminoacyl-tRNA deacylase
MHPDVAAARAREANHPRLPVPVEDLAEVEALQVWQRERLYCEQPVCKTQSDVERPAARGLRHKCHSPLAVGKPPRLAGEPVDVLRDHVHGRHARQSTVPAVRALVQRVASASVTVDGERIAAIGNGLLVLLGVHEADGEEQADRIAAKLDSLRVFEDGDGKLNLSVRDAGGELLVVSNFTLYGDAGKGNRPSFMEAARPEIAEPLVERVRSALGPKEAASEREWRSNWSTTAP